MAYDKSKERVLESKRVPHFSKNPDWGATVVSVIQYEDKKPTLRLDHWFKTEDGEERVLPFVKIPLFPDVIENIYKTMSYLAEKHRVGS
jgi:hypothetical protein